METLKEYYSLLNTREITEHSQKILVVEDDITFEAIWDHIIQMADRNAKMEWATSVPEALKMITEAEARGTPFDMVISDIFLSGSKTGIDLWIQTRREFHEKFVLVSAADQMKMLKRLRDVGEPLYLQKPLIIPEAVATVHGILRRA